MIYVLIGTKAQLIKMFPLLQRFERDRIPYRYIDTVQHGPFCEQLRKRLSLAEPAYFLSKPGTQIESTGSAVRWAMQVVAHGFWHRKKIFPEKGVVLVHGDTLSTLIGLILARLCGQKVCHVEAGERTHNLTRPFPEEIIRRVVDRYSHLLLACGDTQHQNIERAGIRNATVNLRYNTLLDAVAAVAAEPSPERDTSRPNSYIMVSIHRFETISSRQRMTFLVESLERLASSSRIVFGVHPPTRRKLEEFGLLERLKQTSNIELRGLFDYPDFIRTLANSKYIITDGGGPQEESFFIGKPCLLFRSETERAHPNVFMPQWDLEKVRWFNDNYQRFKTEPLSSTESPSDTAVKAIAKQFDIKPSHAATQ